ncbi:MAG: hypothetical protein R3D57_09015 [Hyphomicrobiaceae bacterium]
MSAHSPRRWIAASALWSLAEATVFFVVPDVILSATTVRFGARAGVVAALAAAVAAAAGGLLVYLATADGLVDSFALLDRLPAISAAMIAGVRAELAGGSWPAAMLWGSFSGIPYKLYAASAAAAAKPLGLFLLWSVPIRLTRFVLIVGAAALLRPLVLSWLGPRLALLPLALMWIAFYSVFWLRMPG